METRAEKINFLKSLVATKTTCKPINKPVKHLDLSADNISNISLNELIEYFEYVRTLSDEQVKDLPFNDEQVCNALINRITHEHKIRLLKWFNDGELFNDSGYTNSRFTFKKLESFTLHEISSAVGEKLGRKFNPATDYPAELTKEEMMVLVKAAPPIRTDSRFYGITT